MEKNGRINYVQYVTDNIYTNKQKQRKKKSKKFPLSECFDREKNKDTGSE